MMQIIKKVFLGLMVLGACYASSSMAYAQSQESGWFGMGFMPGRPKPFHEYVDVSAVVEGASADEASVLRGDIIIAINGEKVLDSDDFFAKTKVFRPGDRVELTLISENESRAVLQMLGKLDTYASCPSWLSGGSYACRKVIVTLGTRPVCTDGKLVSGGAELAATRSNRGSLGVNLIIGNHYAGKYFGTLRREGASVGNVLPGGAASEAGVNAVDVILAIDGVTIVSNNDLLARMRLQGAIGKKVELLLATVNPEGMSKDRKTDGTVACPSWVNLVNEKDSCRKVTVVLKPRPVCQ